MSIFFSETKGLSEDAQHKDMKEIKERYLQENSLTPIIFTHHSTTFVHRDQDYFSIEL
ncbi:hypothetical protein SAMN05421788_11486 [Filimonas lacunae]|uniref:Uncharacterized protein n=1 Tax=Filimonas lacunae TaxID=477680 RepID=A0A1N7RFT8_9BACT|nr:hypothetical protein SAMN05421788_11486 [Filimonas lacunae]